ncbi:Mitochondrial intermediate peptidase [Schistosoma japonicum]|nr:Mitochondrial intermediate peptidase [Schistosoma japonicum]
MEQHFMGWSRLPLFRSHHYVCRRLLATRAKLSPLADAFNYHGLKTNDEQRNKTTGLFGYSVLTSPHSFQSFVKSTTEECHILCNEAISQTRVRKMVQILDDMSDALCRVADLSDCIRMLHPDEAYRYSAQKACQLIGQLVEELNTNSELYNASVRANSTSQKDKLIPDIHMDNVDKRVLGLFVADFELSGVQLQDPCRHEQFVRAASLALNYGSEFVEGCYSTVTLPSKYVANSYSDSSELIHPLSDHPDPFVRLSTYRTYYAPIDGQEKPAGFENYAKRATLHSLAETPENINEFLEHVCRKLRPISAEVVRKQLLPIVKNSYQKITTHDNVPVNSNSKLIWPSDLPYTIGVKRQTLCSHNLADYFSLGACMEGVSQLASCLFGLRLEVVPVQPGETWHPSVIKVHVYSNKSNSIEPIGIVYCDLLDRPGKPAQDCHYTIRGGRCIFNGFYTQSYQSPIITLQLTLSPSESSATPPLLSLGQVENLFHEWGHALHSMLAHPRVTLEYARHWKTGQKPDSREIIALQQLSIGRGLGLSLEVSQQATYAILDQILHSGPTENTLLPYAKLTHESLRSWPASTKLLSDIQYKVGLSDWCDCSPAHIGAWPHRFTHLVNYGGRYYSYLLARAGADLVWRRYFSKDPWSSSNGQRYVEKLLCRGGEYPPASMLSDLLDDNVDSDIDNNNLTSNGQIVLSPVKLAEGLTDQLEETEIAAASLINRIESPSLFRPELYN